MKSKKIILLTLLLVFIFGVNCQAAVSLRPGVEKMAEKLVTKLEEKQDRYRIAITDFISSNDQQTKLSMYIAKKLTVSLIPKKGDKIELVSRDRLKEVFEEQKFTVSGLVDQDTAQQIGKILGADGVVLGSYFELGDEVELIAKVIDTETGEVWAGTTIVIKKSDFIDKMMDQKISSTYDQASTSSNQHLKIKDLSKSTSGLEATVTGSVTDSDSSLSEVRIDWGDGNTTTINSGFNMVNESYNYRNSGTYEITVQAIADDGETVNRIVTVRVKNNINNPTMVNVPAGTAADGDTSIYYDIEMGKYEVIHAEFIEFLNSAGVTSDGSYEGEEVIDMDDSACAVGYDGSFYFLGSSVARSENTPVIEVTWHGVLAYCNWLSRQKGLNPAYNLSKLELKDEPQNLEGYRLPTETEWEYAARGGTNGNNTIYAGSDNINDVAWYWRNSGDEYLDGDFDYSKIENNNCRIHSVGKKQANELGIYDMSGNVWELTNGLIKRPTGHFFRVAFGGSWDWQDYHCELDTKSGFNPSASVYRIGFRLAKTK